MLVAAFALTLAVAAVCFRTVRTGTADHPVQWVNLTDHPFQVRAAAGTPHPVEPGDLVATTEWIDGRVLPLVRRRGTDGYALIEDLPRREGLGYLVTARVAHVVDRDDFFSHADTLTIAAD